jgi:hypothetical protein
MKTGQNRALERFNALDLYDDELKSVRVAPVNSSKNSTIVELELIDDGTGRTKWLTFYGCANIRHNMDFDVVADHFFALTQKASASADVEKMKKFVEGHRRHWRTTYMPPSHADLPIRKKMATLRSFSLFKINFHGGTIELLARRFSLSAQSRLKRRRRRRPAT